MAGVLDEGDVLGIFPEGRITAETAIDFADSSSNVKIQIKTSDAGKKISASDNWGSNLTLEPNEADADSGGDVVAEFGKF